jgi:hypothetical protein
VFQPSPRSRSSGFREVALIFDVTARVALGPVEVDDAGIQAMCRIEFAEHCAVQPLIGPHLTESAPPNTGVSRPAISIRCTPLPTPAHRFAAAGVLRSSNYTLYGDMSRRVMGGARIL